MARRKLLVTVPRVLAAGVALLSWWAPVRAEAPSNRYEINDDTVYDTRTELTWRRTAIPDVSSATVDQICVNGWRAPTIKELQSLVDARSGIAFDPIAFPNSVEGFYLSSTPVVGTPNGRWTVYANVGMTIPNDGLGALRCVR